MLAIKDFHHPFQPYDIQQEFMQAVYDCIEDKKVGIFESPTGTGKSLSLICGSLTWLREHKRKTYDESISAIQLEDDEPEWMVEHAREAQRKEARQMRTDLAERLESVRKREEKVRERQANGEPPMKRRRQAKDEQPSSENDDEQFVLDDYESDDEKRSGNPGSGDYSSDTTKLLGKLGMLLDAKQKRSTEEISGEPKIFFCSRTHSQLSQCVGELQRVKLPPGLPPEAEEKNYVEELRHLSLGSRKNLCVNPEVAKLENQTSITEKCLELQQSSTPADRKCPYLPNRENEELVLDFRDHALAKIRDIEDLAYVGSKLGICPYYASRAAISPAEIVTLPYPLILQKTAREALGISLKDQIVIIDEAHNVINALEGIHSAEITEVQLSRAKECLMLYLQKFRNRLKGGNRIYVTQVVRVIVSLLFFVAGRKSTREVGGIVQPSALLSGKAVDQVNLAKLVRYITESKLARKVDGYVAYVENGKDDKRSVSYAKAETPTLTQVQNFLLTLMNPSSEGRFFWSKEGDTVVVRYLLLDPSEHFRDIVEEARSVILAGGTMSPIEEYRQQLFPYVSSPATLSCGHLIPPINLLVRTIAADGNGPLEFNFRARSEPKMARRIAQALLTIALKVKGGLVVFFPSYGYLEQVIDRWRHDSLIDKLSEIKAVFFDKRDTSVEETFKAYSDAIKTSSEGAILFSVIGGKLSEGINFSDDLGRCVMVVGLPFPNTETPEWKAKIQYINSKAAAKGQVSDKAGREHVENVCMRSVNQAIGRVIRHKNDWASILLMDNRYTQDRIRSKLPGWIKESFPLAASSALDEVTVDVAGFFNSR